MFRRLPYLQTAVALTDADSSEIGKRIILPSSYIGGDRFMQSIFQDSMAIVARFGHPTLFITFTANPKWVDESINRIALTMPHGPEATEYIRNIGPKLWTTFPAPVDQFPRYGAKTSKTIESVWGKHLEERKLTYFGFMLAD